MAELSSIYALVRPMAPRVPDFALDAIARIVFRDFCTRTRAYRAPVDDVVLGPGQPDATFSAPADMEVLRLPDVRLDGRKIYPRSVDLMDTGFPRTDWRDIAPGTTSYYVSDEYDPLRLKLLPPPKEGGTLSAWAVVRPTGNFTTVPDRFSQWDSILATGVKAHLLEMPGTEFTNLEQARVEFNRYDAGCGDVRFAIERGGVDAPAHVQMIPFA